MIFRWLFLRKLLTNSLTLQTRSSLLGECSSFFIIYAQFINIYTHVLLSFSMFEERIDGRKEEWGKKKDTQVVVGKEYIFSHFLYMHS